MKAKLQVTMRVAALVCLWLVGSAAWCQEAGNPDIPQSTAPAEEQAQARRLLQEATARRYRWDKELKSFTADFSLTRDGKTVKGSVTVKLTGPRGDIQVSCDDEAAKQAVREVLGNTVLHTRATTFDDSFGNCSFALAGAGKYGGTVIKLTGHSFFKDFTVKDGFIVQNHGGVGGFLSEVNVHQLTWIAELGKTVPKESSATISFGAGQDTTTRHIHTWEDWGQAHGYWFPVRHRSLIIVGDDKTETLLLLDNFQVEKTSGN